MLLKRVAFRNAAMLVLAATSIVGLAAVTGTAEARPIAPKPCVEGTQRTTTRTVTVYNPETNKLVERKIVTVEFCDGGKWVQRGSGKIMVDPLPGYQQADPKLGSASL